MKGDCITVCPHCSSSVVFREFGGIGFRFHWVGDLYYIDVVLLCEGFVFGLFRVMFCLEK